MDKVEEIFNEFWSEIVCNPDGSLNKEEVMKELYDYHFVLENVPKVYCAITNNTLSKPNYHAHAVISCYEEHLQADIDQAIEDYKKENE